MLEIGKNSGNIHWVTKSKAYLRDVGDIQINVTRLKYKYHASVILRNNQYKKFPSGYVMFGISGSRLYFVDSNSTDGYKLSSSVSSSSRYIKASDETLVDWCRSHKGSYLLNFDTDNSLYYVETQKGE